MGFQCVVVSDEAHIKHVLAGAKSKNYVKSQSAFVSFGPFLGGGLVLLEHEEWKFHRTLINPLFRFDSLKQIAFDIFLETIVQATESLSLKIDQAPDHSVQMDLHIYHLTTMLCLMN